MVEYPSQGSSAFTQWRRHKQEPSDSDSHCSSSENTEQVGPTQTHRHTDTQTDTQRHTNVNPQQHNVNVYQNNTVLHAVAEAAQGVVEVGHRVLARGHIDAVARCKAVQGCSTGLCASTGTCEGSSAPWVAKADSCSSTTLAGTWSGVTRCNTCIQQGAVAVGSTFILTQQHARVTQGVTVAIGPHTVLGIRSSIAGILAGVLITRIVGVHTVAAPQASSISGNRALGHVSEGRACGTCHSRTHTQSVP